MDGTQLTSVNTPDDDIDDREFLYLKHTSLTSVNPPDDDRECTRLSPLSTPLMMTGSAHVSHLCQHSRITGSSFTSSTRLSPLSTLSHGKELHLHFKDTSLTSVNTPDDDTDDRELLHLKSTCLISV